MHLSQGINCTAGLPNYRYYQFRVKEKPRKVVGVFHGDLITIFFFFYNKLRKNLEVCVKLCSASLNLSILRNDDNKTNTQHSIIHYTHQEPKIIIFLSDPFTGIGVIG